MEDKEFTPEDVMDVMSALHDKWAMAWSNLQRVKNEPNDYSDDFDWAHQARLSVATREEQKWLKLTGKFARANMNQFGM